MGEVELVQTFREAESDHEKKPRPFQRAIHSAHLLLSPAHLRRLIIAKYTTMLRVDNLPPLETWDGSITGESPCGAGSGSGASNAAEEGEDHKRDTQGECASLAADCLYNDDGCWLTGSEVEEILKIWEDEEKRDKEDKSTDGVENDGSDHGLRNLYARVLHFFAHGDNHAGRRSGVCCLQEANTESPSWSPARQRLKFSEDELC